MFRFAARYSGSHLSVYAGRSWARLSCTLQSAVAQSVINRVPEPSESSSASCFDDLQQPTSFSFSLQSTPPSPAQHVLDVVPVQPAASSCLRACVPAFSPSSTTSSSTNFASSFTFQCRSPSLLKLINHQPPQYAPVIIKETNVLFSFKSLFDNRSRKTSAFWKSLLTSLHPAPAAVSAPISSIVVVNPDAGPSNKTRDSPVVLSGGEEGENQILHSYPSDLNGLEHEV